MIANEVLGRYRIEVEAGCHCKFDVQPTNARHMHTYYEICYVLSGHGTYHHGSLKFPLSKGTAFVADVGVPHEITSFETRDLELFFCSFQVTEVASRGASPEDDVVESFLNAHRIAARAPKSLVPYVDLIIAGTDTSWADYAARNALKMFCLELMAGLCEPATRSEEPAGPPPWELATAYGYLDRHVDRRVSVHELATVIGVSERTLRRRFLEYAGQGVAAETNHRKMMQAAHRLLMGFSVQETASFVGIEDPAQFARAFRRVHGVAPREYQKSYRPGWSVRRTLPA
jgi:AraC family L-rhamnose operon transcriptional activator RhaR